MINHTEQPLSILPHHTNTHTSTGELGHVCETLPRPLAGSKPMRTAVILSLCLVGGYSTHHRNSKEIYNRERRKSEGVSGGGKNSLLTWMITASDLRLRVGQLGKGY